MIFFLLNKVFADASDRDLLGSGSGSVCHLLRILSPPRKREKRNLIVNLR